MKKHLLMAIVTAASTSVYASKARYLVLKDSHTTPSDFQQVFEEPGRMGDVPDQLDFEFGTTRTNSITGATTPSNSNAEGGFLRSHNEYRYGAYLGHQDRSLLYLTRGDDGQGNMSPIIYGAALSPKAQYAENPLNLFFGGRRGEIRYGLNVYYSNSTRASGVSNGGGGMLSGSVTKQGGGVALGAKTDLWDVYVVAGLLGKYQDSTATGDTPSTFTGNSTVRLGGGYNLPRTYLYGYITSLSATLDNADSSSAYNLSHTDATVGAENKLKSDLVNFYYGARIDYVNEKNSAATSGVGQFEVLRLPVYMGIEADATSWLTLRASLTQNVLYASTKITSTTPTVQGNDNLVDSTYTAAGASLKFNKLSVDAMMATNWTGAVTNTSLNYTF